MMTETETRRVVIQFEVWPDNVETEEDLLTLARSVIDMAHDQMLREDDFEAWRKKALDTDA